MTKQMQYRNPVVAQRVERWLAHGGELELAEAELGPADLSELACDLRVAPFVTEIRLVDNPARKWAQGLDALRGFKKLVKLDLRVCSFGETDGTVAMLADGLRELPQLRELLIYGNGLTWEHLTRVLAFVPKLRSLDAGMNELVDLDHAAKAMRAVPDLEELKLDTNFFVDAEKLAGALRPLRSLRSLEIKSCYDLDDVLPFAVLLPQNGGSLETLRADSCPKVRDRYKVDEAIFKTTNAADFFQLIATARTRQRVRIPVVKCVVLGDGGVGKTHLRHRLADRDPRQDGRIPDSTASFEVEELRFRDASFPGGRVDIRLFDFGGQPYMHAAHRLFMASERNLFVIVCRGDLSPEAAHLPYWLRLVRNYGRPQAPVVVVRSWADRLCDSGWSEWDAARMSEEFGLRCQYVEDYMELSSLTEKRPAYRTEKLHEIRACIRNAASTLREALETLYEAEFLDLKRWVEGDNASLVPQAIAGGFVTCDEFAAAARAAGAASVAEVRLWRDILGHLGLIAYLGDLPDAKEPANRALRDYVFDPNWLRGPLYALVTPGHWNNPVAYPGAVVPVDNVEAELRARGLDAASAQLTLAVARATRLIFDAMGRTGLPKGYLIVDLLPDEPTCMPLAEKPRRWKQTGTTRLPFVSDAYLPRLIGELQAYLKSPVRTTFRSWAIFGFADPSPIEVLVRVDPNRAAAEFYTLGGDAASRVYRTEFVRDRFRELSRRDGIDPDVPQIDEVLTYPPHLQRFLLVITACREANAEFDTLPPAEQTEQYNRRARLIASHDHIETGELSRDTYERYKRSTGPRKYRIPIEKSLRNFDRR